MRYMSLVLFVVVIGISSVAEGQKYDKSSPKYSEGHRVKQETFDWREKWPGLGCDSEQSCTELLAQYVEGREGYVDIIDTVHDEDPSGPVTASDDETIEGLNDSNIEKIAEIEAQLQDAQEPISI